MKSLICAILLTFSLAGAAADPVAWKLADGPAKAVKPGARFTVNLVARVEEGWHLYSMKHVEDGPVATRIWLADGQPFQLAEAVKSSRPETLQDPSFNMEVELYEGEATFTLPLKVAAGSAAGAQTLVVNASYQSCNNKICLPPKTVKVELPVTVAK
ncbi:MAG: protein-disulfide reductase DsbD N-terminal domain-containing protein [Candidatus Sulfopaludibacter sp.]|nr:protein-disulfide reductase DsbD N-terminal domain-containing protein [Candidatus Sulfopaludibacter sp.]